MGGLYDELRLTFTPDPAGAPVFVGFIGAGDARRYLDGVGHTVIHDSTPVGDRKTEAPGGAPDQVPARSDGWLAGASGAGAQTVTWAVEPGEVTVVAMRADGAPGLSGHVSVEAKVESLPWIGVAALLGGVLALAGAVLFLIVRPLRRGRG